MIENKQQEIVYTTSCDRCAIHKTQLGNLVSAVEGVFTDKTLSDMSLSDADRLLLAKTLFEQICLDQRTAQIQSYKKDNIKTIARS